MARTLVLLAAFTLLSLAGCKVKSYKNAQIRTHEGLVHSFCADSGGYVQVNIDSCTVAGFPFYGEFVLNGAGSYTEWKTLRDGTQVRFDRKVLPGQCGSVNIVNMDDGASVSCNFNVYWDL